MINKQSLIKYINELPEEFPIDELLNNLMLIHKIELGLEQSNNDQTTPHREVKDRLDKWLK
jgi:hypothetical protein